MSEDSIIITSRSKEQKLEDRKEKRKKVGKGYYDIPEPEIQDIIKRAQSGSSKDQEYLLKIFSNFLEKYVNMLHNGYYDLRDYDIKRFVTLYIGNKSLAYKVRNNSLDLKSYKEVNSVIKGIIFMIMRYNDEDDIRQTVNMTFLQCVLPYKQQGDIPFSGYLYSYFFYLLKRNIDHLLIDQLGLKTYPLMTDDSVSSSYDQSDTTGMVHESVAPTSPNVEDLLGIDDIDENWVLGEACSYPFNQLSIAERQLIKWRFVDRLRPNKISLKTSDHPNTCRQHIKTLVEKIQGLMEFDPIA